MSSNVRDDLQELSVSMTLSDIKRAVENASEIKEQLGKLKTSDNSPPDHVRMISSLEAKAEQLIDTLNVWKNSAGTQNPSLCTKHLNILKYLIDINCLS